MELLVVIATIAILAGLIFPALANGARQARSAKCVSNLRQLGITVTIYLQDDSSFPFATQDGITGAWQKSLATVQSGLDFDCPTSVIPSPTFIQIFNWTGGAVYPHYGYNVLGAAWQGSPPYNPGLGGDVNIMTGSRTPTPSTRVLHPAQMIVIGDSPVFINVPFGSQPQADIPNQIYVAIPYDVKPINNAGVGDWHGKGANMLFGDVHVQFAKQSYWIAATDQSRRLWNSDNQPHEEWW